MGVIVQYEELWKRYYNVPNIFDLKSNPDALIQHVSSLVLSIVFLLCVQALFYVLLEKLQPKWYIAYGEKQDVYPRSYLTLCWMDNTHHIIQAVMAITNVMTLCDIPAGQFLCDEQCLLSYKPFVSHSIMFSLAYFIIEIVEIKYFFFDSSKITAQILVHHYLCIFVFLVCLCGGRDLPAISQTVMLCEISNVFLNIRETILGKDATGLVATLNSAMIFICFTLFRVLYFPLQLNGHFHTIYYYDVFGQSFFYIFTWIFALIIFFLVFLLNLYWYQFLLKGLQKMLFSSDSAKKTKDLDGDNNYEKIQDEM